MGIVTLGIQIWEAGYESEDWYFALEITESFFSEIYSKIIEKDILELPVYRDNIDQIEGVLFVKDLLCHLDEKDFEWNTLIREPFLFRR
jgi:Mg2+/Co2+ transporter CorB